MAPAKMQEKQYYVLHQVCEQIVKVVASYPTKEEAFTVALNKQVEVLQAMKDDLVIQMRQDYCANRSCEWKLKMLQGAMEKYIADMGLEGWTDNFLVMSTQVNSFTPASHIRIRWKRKCDDIAPQFGSWPHDDFGSRPTTIAKYMYWTLPFGPVE